MPLYDYKCECGHRMEIFKKLKDYARKEYCPDCSEQMFQTLENHNKRDWFRPGVWEDLDVRPVEITSKKHLREECKKRGLQARCLL